MSTAELARTVTAHGAAVLPSVSDTDAVVTACAGTLRPHTLGLRPGARLAARLEHLPVGGFSVNRLVYGADVTITPAAGEEDDFLLTLPVAGRAGFRYGGTAATASAEQGVLIGPYHEFQFDIGADFDQVIVRLDRRRVEAVAATLTGSTGPVHFQLALDAAVASLDGLIATAADLARSGVAAARPQLLWQLEQLLIETLLLSQPSNRSPELRGAAAPSPRVRQAMDLMVDRLAEPLSIGTVAAECGVSVRTLQDSFRRELDTTPGAWLREQRLQRAHVLLTSGTLSVTEVAYACGMFHLGEFATAFKRRYGVSPSALRSPTGPAVR